MKILIVAQHYAVCSARYAADAFTRLGHDVRHVGAPMGNQIWGLSLPERYTWQPDATSPFNHDYRDWPELVIVMDSDPAILDAGSYNKLYNCPVVIFGVDNHVRDYRRPWFDHYFLAHRDVSLMPWNGTKYQSRFELRGIAEFYPINDPNEDMTWLPCAMDPTLFTPSPIPWAEREYDVCCLGVMYPQRVELVNAMQAAGLKVLWGCGLVYESYAAAMQNSRVSLCVSARGDVAQRIYESAASGCAVLSDPLKDLEALGAHPVQVYHGVEDAVEMARTLQDFPEIGETGPRWAERHTWDARAQTLLATCVERGLIGEGVAT